MPWDLHDAAPAEKLNRIVWRNVMGDRPYPGAVNALFAPYYSGDEEEEG